MTPRTRFEWFLAILPFAVIVFGIAYIFIHLIVASMIGTFVPVPAPLITDYQLETR